MSILDSRVLSQSAPGVATPSYDRERLTPGIVHFGVGAFHRSHQAMFIDRVLADGNPDWAICGVGLRPADREVVSVLSQQDNLYTLVTSDPQGYRTARVIGSIVETLYAPDDPQVVLDRLTSAGTHIVSLTITEGGYGIDDATGHFDPSDPATLADLADPTAPPTSVWGFLTAALATRRRNGDPAFTVMSCDNIEHNGTVARAALIAFAGCHDPDLASWISDTVAFPNSMVDRITPATDSGVIEMVTSVFDLQDEWPVHSESFVQWVIEDRFSDGRPPFERVGVQVVDDVAPYEFMKLRLLNASHQVMSYLGVLAGHTHVHEVMGDPVLSAFVASYMRHEAVATLPPVPGVDVEEYIDALLARFASPAISDTLARQTVDASTRIPKFLLPVIRDRLRRNMSVDHIALALAAWCAVYDQRTIPMVDQHAEQLQRLAWADHDAPGAFLAHPAVFGDLATNVRLRGAYQCAKRELQDRGPRGAAEFLLDRAATGGR